MDFSSLKEHDIDIFNCIKGEFHRQQNSIELIASENFTSKAVMEAMGSYLTNKYAEGYPSKRYYGGCEFVDEVETIAINRVKELFGSEHANVQPHSGAQANLAVYFALLNPGDTVVGMSLSNGGHLTHGSKVNLSGKYYNFIPYGVSEETETIDYNQLEDIVKKNNPKLIVAGASAYPRIIDFKLISDIAKRYGCLFMVDMAHIAGLVAAGLHPSPVPYADIITSTTHKTLRGPRGGFILCKNEFAEKIDKAIFPGTQGGPLMHVIAGKAVCFGEALKKEFKIYQNQVIINSKTLANSLINSGLNLVSGGTDNHLMLVNLTETGRNGKEIEELLGKANITVNKNTVPNETRSPFITSGIRIGTPAVTTRGFKENDMVKLASLIHDIIVDGDKAVNNVLDEVKILTGKYPLYE